MHFDIASPAAVARRLNQQFPMTSEIPQYFTMVYGILDQHTGELRYLSAGHPGPILIPKSGNAACLENQGFPVGLLPEAVFQDDCLQLQPGDRLYLYTDGVPETANAHEEEFGIERCKSRLFQDRHQPLSQSLDSLICALDEWRRDDPIRDDITLLGVEYRGAP